MKQSKQTLTSIDYIILGLLQRAALTGYGIRKIFETTPIGIYSSSPGTIYPALKRLQKMGLIVNKSDDTTGKSFLHIQERGTAALVAWLQSPVTQQDIQRRMSELILRFALMDEVITPTVQIAFIKNLMVALKKYLQQLTEYYTIAKSSMGPAAQLAFEHGLATYRSDLTWAKRALKTLQSIH